MKSKGIRTVKIANIKTNLYVRKDLDQDWVLQLAEIIEAHLKDKDADMLLGMRDPMEVTDNNDGTYDMVDGRHRKNAYEFHDVEEVKVKVFEFDSAMEGIAYAFNRNKGSKPPTSADVEHTIEEMSKLGLSLKKIAEMLELPATMVQAAMEKIRAETKRRALCKGEELILDQGFKVVDAAKEAGIKVEELRGFMGRHRKRRTDVVDMQKELTRFFRSIGQKIARLFDKVFKQYEVGDLSKKQVENILDKVDALNKQSAKTLADRRDRFDRKANGSQDDEREKKKESA